MYKLEYREDIDALRGVSVALVVFFHAIPDFLPGGFIGVDVFFVISGYLITSIMLLSLRSNSFSLLEFYARRIRRIFPAMVFVLAVVLVLGWLILFPAEYQQLGKHVKSSIMFLLNFDLIDELGYFDVESNYKPLIHFWTLSIEEQYYLLWPVLLLVFMKFSRRPAWFFLLIVVVSFSMNFYIVDDYEDEIFFHSATRLWELATGSLLAAVAINRDIPSRNVLFLVGLAVIILAGFFITKESFYPGFLALAPVGGAVLVILSNARFTSYLGLSSLGLISYSLYLWHWVLISFGHIYIGREPSNPAVAFLVIVSVAAAYFTYRYIEPLRYRRKVVAGLLLSAIFIACMGFYVERENGLPGRAQVAYYQDAGYQFMRTPASDAVCNNFVEQMLGKERLFYYCRAENLREGRLIAVVGDSHAHAWFPGLADVALRHGYGALLLANSSCPPFLGFEWGRNEKQREKCQLSIRQIRLLLERDTRIKKVALVTRGPVYIHGEVDGSFTTESVAKSLRQNVDGSRLSYATYFSGFRELLEYLENLPHISRVYYLLENPELDFLPKEVIPRPFDFFKISTNRNYMSRGLHLMRMARYRRGVYALESTKLVVLDATDLLCDDGKCHSFINDNFVYADDDHFSVFGSKLVAEYFESLMFSGQFIER